MDKRKTGAAESLLQPFSGLRCVITGGLGFIGSNLAIELVSQGAQVTIVDELLEGCGGNIVNIAPVKEAVQVIVGDVATTPLKVLSEADMIFNLAGSTSHIDSMTHPLMDARVNAASHLAFLEQYRASGSSARVLFTSTRQVYGKAQTASVSEDHPVSPLDINGIHKVAAEGYHQQYYLHYGVPTLVIRLGNIYGPRQLVRHNRQGFVGWFVRIGVERGEISVFGDGAQRRDLLYVDDAVSALIACGQDPKLFNGRVLNLAGAKLLTIGEIAETIVGLCPGTRIAYQPFPPERETIDIGDIVIDSSSLMSVTGWRPLIESESGLARMIEHLNANLEHYV